LKNFGLSKSERIKKARDFKKIYLEGKVIFSGDGKLKVTFLIGAYKDNSIVKVSAAVSKKTGKAVWRNRLKRLIKESYRLNKHELIEACSGKNVSLDLIFTPIGFSRSEDKKVKLAEFLPAMLDILNKVKSCL
jgi:ribonuclease P protein component